MSEEPEPAPPPGYRTQSEDTGYEIERVLIATYRRMPPWEKARRVGEMLVALDQLALAGIAVRHPGAGERERRLRLAALRLDRDTMVRVFGWDPLIHGY
jgi:hypothetical protein